MRKLVLTVISLCLWTTASAATVTMLDGQVATGNTIKFDGKGTVVIGGKSLALADCDWIEIGDGSGTQASANSAKKQLGIWLTDGSWMPVTSITAAAADNILKINGVFGEMALPLTAVRGWGIGSELIGQEGKDDQVLLDSGLLTGRIEGLVGGNLILKSPLDPTKPLELAIKQIRGVRLALPMKSTKGLSLSVHSDDVHPPLKVLPTAQGLMLHAAPKINITAELTPYRLRITGGRRVYLNEMDPDICEETGAFGVVWPYQRGKNLDGSPLRLGGVRYENGITVHSKARLGWKLDGAYERLRAYVGIADIVGDQGDCAVSILVDDKVVWNRTSIRGGEKPQELDLDLKNAKRLELRVDYGARYDIADHLVLADAFLITVK